MSLGSKKSDVGNDVKAQGQNTMDWAKPMVDQAVKSTRQGQNFALKFFQNHVQPALQTSIRQSREAMARNDELYGKSLDQYNNREDQYRANAHLIDDYGNRLANFNESEFAAQNTNAALGDLGTAQKSAEAQNQRAIAARGAQNSGAAYAGQRGTGMAVALEKARIAQAERARAQAVGNQMAAEGANLAMGLRANSVGDAASLAGQGAALGQSTLSSVNSAAAVPMAGYGLGAQALGAASGLYTSGMSGMSSGAQMNAEANANNGAGIGKMLGTVVGGIGGYMLGGPAGALKGASIGSGISV